jgi:hypothetical protein
MYTSFRKGKLLWPLLLVSVAWAAQTISFTLTKPVAYEDGTAFGTEQLVYIVYDQATDKQLFSTFNLTNVRTDIPDGVTCFYAKAGVYNLTTNAVLPNTLSKPSTSSCKVPPPPVAKPVAAPGLKVS